MGVTGFSAKLINIVVPRRNLDIVYGGFIEDESLLSKTLIIKLITESDEKPSYNITIAGPEALL